MLISWEINRYTRCYSDCSKQCLDAEKKSSIFQYFAHLDTQKSQNVGNFWSTINASQTMKIYFKLDLNQYRQIQLLVMIEDVISNNHITLVG